jgi:D-alanyl-D-alanine-carboxypeptidase/D-alanyl-D-alanine-endopeptidase
VVGSIELSPDALRAILGDATLPSANRYGVVASGISGTTSATFATGLNALTGGTPDHRTLFQIGSVTKTFTALALADAVVARSLTLDTPLSS